MILAKAELHCHTTHSDGFCSPNEAINKAQKKGLNILAITDHNTAEGCVEYWNNPVMSNLLVIPGEEVSTNIGHVLAYFIRETITPGPFEKVVSEIHAQGGLAFLAHPYHIPIGNSLRNKSIIKFQEKDQVLIDGIEVTNGHNREIANQMASSLANRLNCRVVGGSDAHFPFEIGNVTSFIECRELSLGAVRDAILLGQIIVKDRKFNGYPNYLLVGLKNRLMNKSYK